jgi:myo-inositol-1(or 4)-monophosphatase
MNLKIKKVAIAAAQKAGRMLLRQYKNFDRGTVELKAHHEILTKADLMSEKIILKEIKKNFPEHRILSEESGQIRNQSDYLWIVDPLDGTTNFSMHNPLWSVSIAVAYQGKVILGVIYAPLLDELYVAEENKGVRRNGKKIKVSGHTKKALHTFCHGRENKYVKKALKYYRWQKLNELDCRQMGSAAIELAFVAGGRTESIMIPGANPWDVAAGVLMVREAGGKVTDFKGKEWILDSKDMLASNGKVHRELLKVINRT